MGAIAWTMAQAHGFLASQKDNRFSPLPPEIIIYIAECLRGMGRTHDLANVTLLQRDLSPAIQGILFNHITLSDFPRCHRLTETLRLGRFTVAPLIRHITAILDTESHIESRLFLAKHLIELYTLCPMLSHITLAGHKYSGLGGQLFPDVLDAPRLGALGTVESLTLTGSPSNFGPYLLFHLPNLQELRLFGDAPISWFNGPPPSSQESLRHITWGLTSPPTLESIKWLFAISSKLIGGSLTLITPPASSHELRQIREYCLSSGMDLRSAPFTGRVRVDLGSSSSSAP